MSPVVLKDSMPSPTRCTAARLSPTDQLYIARRDRRGLASISSSAAEHARQMPSSMRCWGRMAARAYGQGFLHASRKIRGGGKRCSQRGGPSVRRQSTCTIAADVQQCAVLPIDQPHRHAFRSANACLVNEHHNGRRSLRLEVQQARSHRT